MLGVQHACNHSSSCQNQLCAIVSVDTSCRSGCASAAGHRWTLQNRALQVRCHSSYSNNVVSMRASAAAANAQLACERSTVQDLLAHVVQSSTQRSQRHQQQHQQALQHAIDLQRQQHSGHLLGIEGHLPSGLATAPTPALQEQQPPGQQEAEQWPVFNQYQRQVLTLDHQMMVQQVQQHEVHAVAVDDHSGITAQQLHHQRQQHQHHQLEQQQQQQEEAVGLQIDLLLQKSTSLLEELQTNDRQLHEQHMLPQPTSGLNKQELVQGWRYSQQDKVARTAAGLAILRLSTAAQPTKQARQLASWLRREQKVILSAAGAALAYTALQCLAQVQLMLQQQLPQYQLLVTAEFKSSRRPEGRGRCEVYNLTCSLQPLQQGVEDSHNDEQQRVLQSQQQQSQQHHADSQAVYPEVTSSQQHSAGVASHLDLGGQLLQQLQTASEPAAQPQHCCQLSVDHHAAASLACHSGGPASAPSAVVTEQQSQWPEYGHHRPAVDALHLSSSTLHCLHAHQQHALQQPWLCLHQACHVFTQQHLLQQQQQHGLQLQQHGLQQQQHHTRPQQRHRQRQKQRQQEVDQPLADIQWGEVRGATVHVADMLDQKLQQHVGVMLPVAYAKQAVRVLEAAAIVNRRWQQQRNRRGSAVAVNIQAWPGTVQRQSGSKRGLHILLCSAAVVQQ